MTEFLYIELEGFGSFIKRFRYKLKSKGLNLIKGENGVGKTTLLNALTWALFGKRVKKDSSIAPWPHVIDENYQGTRVKVAYKKDGELVEIIHCKDYTPDIESAPGKDRLIIYVNGVYQAKLKDKNQGWAWIINNLGASFDLFKSSVVFGQKIARLMDEKGPERNKILEEAFEAAFITNAKNKIDQKLRMSKPVLKGKEDKMETLRESIDSLSSQLKRIKKEKKAFTQGLEKEVKQAKREINEIDKKLAEPIEKTDTKKQLKKIESKIEKATLTMGKDWNDIEFRLMLEVHSYETKRDELETKLKKLKESLLSKDKVCIYCGSALNDKKAKKQKKETKEKYNSVNKELKTITAQLESLQEKHKEAKIKVEENRSIESKIALLKARKSQILLYDKAINDSLTRNKQYKEQRESLLKSIEKIKARKFPISSKALKKELAGLDAKWEKALGEWKTLKDEIDIDEWLLKDPLSNSGLKAYIFDTMLSRTNRELKKYQKYMGFEVRLSINLSSARKDFMILVYKSGEEVPYADLSGGQMQMVSICLAIAIHDSISDNKEFNLLWFDEVFESLSPGNIDKVGELLMEKSLIKCVHVITHQNFNPSNAKYTMLKLNDKEQTITTAA